MRQVKCVSPYGACHHGQRADNRLPAHEGYAGKLTLPPNPGGYVSNRVLGTVAVGSVSEAPDAPGFIADGVHFVDAATGKADECSAPGDGCWCGRHRARAAAAAAAAKNDEPPPPGGGSGSGTPQPAKPGEGK